MSEKKKKKIEPTEEVENVETETVENEVENIEEPEEIEETESAEAINPILNANVNIPKEEDIVSDDSEAETFDENIDEVQPASENIFDNIQQQYDEVSKEKTVQMPEMPEIKVKKSHIKIIVISIISIILLGIIIALCTAFALVAKNNNKIISGITIKNINVSELTKQEALTKLNSLVEQKLNTTITLKHGDYELQITPKQFEATFNIEEVVNAAFTKGRSGNIFADNFEIIGSLFSSTQLNPNFSYSEDTIDSLIKEMENSLPDKYIETSYYIDGSNLIITKGHDGYYIDSASLKNSIVNAMNNLDSTITQIDIPVNFKKIDSIDVDKIHSEIVKQPKDAYYTTNPYVLYPHVDGVEFAISVDEAKRLANQSNEENITIPLTITHPSILTNQLGQEAFPDELGTFSTTFNTANVNRSTNIRLAAEKINGTVVLPGESFSYNATVGQRTTAAGFKSAPAYVGGETKNEVGGGICQVSSTLYNAVLYANLEIEERSNHGFHTGYVAVGRDATVSWGGPDFKFINNRNYPVRIVASADNGTINVTIYGLGALDEPEVRIESYVTKWISYSTVTREDATIPKGETRVVQEGSNGCKSMAYRILLKDDQEISRELLSEDTYNPHNRIIAIGTMR